MTTQELKDKLFLLIGDADLPIEVEVVISLTYTAQFHLSGVQLTTDNKIELIVTPIYHG